MSETLYKQLKGCPFPGRQFCFSLDKLFNYNGVNSNNPLKFKYSYRLS